VRQILIAFFAGIFLLSLSGATLGQNKAKPARAPVKLGVLNVGLIFRTSLMTKDIDSQIDTKRRKFREEILKEEEDLRKRRKELEDKRVLLAPEVFASQARQFRASEGELQKKVQRRNKEFNEFRNKATRAFENALNRAVLAYAKKNNFTLILRQRQIFLSADHLDVSKAVIAVLNKAVPSYKIADRPPRPGK
jgi:Skp family chaperone for outer membrane proteins